MFFPFVKSKNLCPKNLAKNLFIAGQPVLVNCKRFFFLLKGRQINFILVDMYSISIFVKSIFIEAQ